MRLKPCAANASNSSCEIMRPKETDSGLRTIATPALARHHLKWARERVTRSVLRRYRQRSDCADRDVSRDRRDEGVELFVLFAVEIRHRTIARIVRTVLGDQRVKAAEARV